MDIKTKKVLGKSSRWPRYDSRLCSASGGQNIEDTFCCTKKKKLFSSKKWYLQNDYTKLMAVFWVLPRFIQNVWTELNKNFFVWKQPKFKRFSMHGLLFSIETRRFRNAHTDLYDVLQMQYLWGGELGRDAKIELLI